MGDKIELYVLHLATKKLEGVCDQTIGFEHISIWPKDTNRKKPIHHDQKYRLHIHRFAVRGRQVRFCSLYRRHFL